MRQRQPVVRSMVLTASYRIYWMVVQGVRLPQREAWRHRRSRGRALLMGGKKKAVTVGNFPTGRSIKTKVSKRPCAECVCDIASIEVNNKPDYPLFYADGKAGQMKLHAMRSWQLLPIAKFRKMSFPYHWYHASRRQSKGSLSEFRPLFRAEGRKISEVCDRSRCLSLAQFFKPLVFVHVSVPNHPARVS